MTRFSAKTWLPQWMGARRALAVGGAFLFISGGCGAPGGTADPSPMQTPGSQPPLGAVQMGDGTYYGADGSGNCSYEASPGDLMVAAMNNPQYNNSGVCGMCVDVTGPLGKITVRIVDRCPECKSGDLDLSQQAFVRIANQSDGRVKISWVPVACAVSGSVAFRFKEGSSQYWMAVQVRNSRLPISKVELQQGANWLTLAQQDYNYYIASSNPGPGPYTLRITALDGQQLTQSGVALMVAQIVSGSGQFN